MSSPSRSKRKGRDGELSDGLVICWDYREQPTDPEVLTFQARVKPSASGGEITQRVYNIVDVAGTGEVLNTVTIDVAESDSDGDGVADGSDNCAFVANADQRDTDGDGYGNICDGDFNNDGVVNTGDLGYMIEKYNTDDADADLNGSGFVDYDDIRVFKNLFFGEPGPSGLR